MVEAIDLETLKPHITEILIAAAGVTAVGLRWLKSYLEKQGLERSKQGFINTSMVYDILSRYLSHFGANRILILYSENGGGIPVPGKHLHASVLYEVIDSQATPVKQDFQKRLIDEDYARILTTLIQEGKWTWEKGQPLKGLISDVYQHQGVEVAKVYPIRMNTNKFYYLSITWRNRIPIDTSEVNYHVGVMVDLIKKLITKDC